MGEGAKRVVIMRRAVERERLARKRSHRAQFRCGKRQCAFPQPVRAVGTDQSGERRFERGLIAQVRVMPMRAGDFEERCLCASGMLHWIVFDRGAQFRAARQTRLTNTTGLVLFSVINQLTIHVLRTRFTANGTHKNKYKE